jgi:translocation and assembly module TamB
VKRHWKITFGALGFIAFLSLLIALAGLYAVRTGILREQVRRRIIAEAERATGGKVDIGKFSFNWRTLTVQIDSFVVHGTEPLDSPPLLKVSKLVIQLKIISLIEKDFDILSAKLYAPQALLLIAPDGSTNIPSPKVHTKKGMTPMETILDLKIGEFSLSDAAVEIRSPGQPPKIASYDFTAKNLQSKLTYQPKGPNYSGAVSVQALDVRYGGLRSFQLGADLKLTLEKNRLEVTSARLTTEHAHAELTGELQNFTAPVLDVKYSGGVSLDELGSILKLKRRLTGTAALEGNFHYEDSSGYAAGGKIRARNLSWPNQTLALTNVSAASSFQIDPKKIQLTNLAVNLLGGTIDGSASLKNLDSYQVSGTLSHFDIASLTKQSLPYDGIADGPFTLSGRLSDSANQHLDAAAKLNISPVSSGVPISGFIDAQYDAGNNQIVLAPSYLSFPDSRLELNGVLGQRMQVLLDSRNLDDLLPALALTGEKAFPVSLNSGSVRFQGSVTGSLPSPRVEGHLSATNVIYSGELIDSLNADVTAQQNALSLRAANLVYQNVRTAFQGSAGLQNWKWDETAPISASASLRNANIAGLLALAGRKDIPVTGSLTISGQISGTPANPQATATFSLTKGAAYGEPFDRITGTIASSNSAEQTVTAQLQAAAKQIGIQASYRHALNDFRTGDVNFQIKTNRMALAQIATVKKEEPGLAGNAALNATGELSVAKTGARLTALNGDLETTGLTLDRRELSDLKLTARTEAGALKLHLTSNLAHAEISGDGTFALSGNYPGKASLAFSKLDLDVARKLFLPPAAQESLGFGGSAEGKAIIAGDLLHPGDMTADLEIPQFELKPNSNGTLVKEIADITIRNTQTIHLSLAKSLIRVESARFSGPNTDLSLLGSIDLKLAEPLSLNLNGNLDLKLARTFNPDIDSSGNLLVRVTIGGSFENPRLGGLADLRNGNISLAGFPNGLSKASGRITFDANRANIESLTAQTGGGTIQLNGFAAFGGPFVTFRLTGEAKLVRVRYPEGVSSISDANLIWTGSTERSLLSGEVTVHKVSYNQQNDLGAVLSLAAGGPAPTQVQQTGLIGGMQFDVRVQTAPDISLQTGLVSGLRTDANLRLRGSVANPSLLGRINISSGTIDFFGNKYVISEGTISFFNPVRIDPIVNIDLQTEARGVDVTLSISGPLTKLNVTYRSDPPLQFSDIVGLLATGKTPSDPTIAARQTDTQQTWQQLGASALVGQAIANPVSGRLQRFFGVSKLKIDPLLPGLGGAGSSTGGSNPGARLSLEQQVAPNVTFDYVISTNSTSSQVVRVEWAFSRHWSAVIVREENSAFGIDFQYKKRFK